ncbi:hypothetical protein [Sphingomonas sanxanigenens]|uniref:Uncharacterized protein n=1 Tax=Sphingomonas sanxanigenens DSM 19645 = NX02 TaxID=1123269 RepID=W0AJ20_9SPHN|nr:hypothetical protein [Sphingomonas sanxanigenens]AHE56298.1 hypothetical protein NX02_23415 [Sphingomonas sanxanigenens DSM 19645 = NX02]
MGVYEDVTGEGARRGDVEAAVAAISASPEFLRAPVMRRLLDYLVQETLAGRGDQVKAYSVAVDGLGRDPDFDTQADSYPRVQVGRLRRMLDAYYARYPLTAGVGLSIPNGSYKVRLFTAQQAAAPATSVAASATPPAGAVGTRARAEWDAGTAPRRGLRWALVVLAIVALLGAAMLWLVLNPLRSLADAEIVPAPSLELQHVSTDGSPEAMRTGNRVDAVLGDALYRSFVTLIQAGVNASQAAAPDYRLVGRVSTTGGATTLAVQIYHVQSGRQIWSQTVAIPADATPLEPVLRPMIAQIIQPFGVIATDQRARFTDPAAPGFPCLVLYHDYRRTRDSAIYTTVDTCLERSGELTPNKTNVLAARSFMAFDAARLTPGDAPALRRRGARLARDAVRADPFSGVGHYALATAFFAEGRCDLGKASAQRSIELNPYSGEKLATLGAAMFECGDPDAERLLREALLLDPNGPAYTRTPLVILLIRQQEAAEALALANMIIPPMDATRPSYDLTMALAQAANGRRAAAAASWRRVLRSAGSKGDAASLAASPSLSPWLGSRTMEALKEVGLVNN